MKLAGVYVLCCGREFVYIGQTTDLVRRLQVHTQKKRQFNEVLFVSESDRVRRYRIEQTLIGACRPRANLPKTLAHLYPYHELRDVINDLLELPKRCRKRPIAYSEIRQLVNGLDTVRL